MKRERFRYQQPGVKSLFVRLAHYSEERRRFRMAEADRQTRKIFVVTETITASTSTAPNLHRILVVDNHPESLRLLFQSQTNLRLEPVTPWRSGGWRSGGWRSGGWRFVLPSILIAGALLGMLWPLF
jgi:hypothetical protein